jgi:Domain of unknown function DUF29
LPSAATEVIEGGCQEETDGMVTRAEQLYDDDFYAWTRVQAAALRRLDLTRANVEIDLEHLIEEVADLGTNRRDAVRSQLRRILQHCLKLEHSPARDPRPGWRDSIIDGRLEIEDKLSRSLRRDLMRNLPKLYGQARRAAQDSLRAYGQEAAADGLPETFPYALADLLRHGWYPASRHGLEP